MRTNHVVFVASAFVFALATVVACNDTPAAKNGGDPSIEIHNPPSINASTDVPAPQVNSSEIKAPQANGPSVNIGSSPGHDVSGQAMKTDGGK